MLSIALVTVFVEDPTPEVVEQTEFTEVEVSHDSHMSPEIDHVLTQEVSAVRLVRS